MEEISAWVLEVVVSEAAALRGWFSESLIRCRTGSVMPLLIVLTLK